MNYLKEDGCFFSLVYLNIFRKYCFSLRKHIFKCKTEIIFHITLKIKKRGVIQNMKNSVSIIVVGLVVLTSFGAAAISLDDQEQTVIADFMYFSPPDYLIQNDYTYLSLSEATARIVQTNMPNLPMVTKVYTFPFGTTIDGVNVVFGSSTEIQLEKPVMFSPAPQVTADEDEVKIETEGSTLQSQESWYPISEFSYRVGCGLNDGTHVVFLALQLYPLQYKQEDQTVRYYDEAAIHITTTQPAFPMSFGDTYSLLILTPSQFTTQLQPLVTYKNDNGIPTVMVTLDDVPHVGVDIQEDIKYYIKSAIETWGVTSVILVGAGVEGQEIFPVRNAWIPSDNYEDYFPSDLYYADIYTASGGVSDWDFDNDGKYLEYPWDLLAADLYPDVYLSRLACNDASEVRAVVDKIIDFKEHNKVMTKVLQLGGDTFPGDNEHINEGEYSNTKVLTKLPGYTPIQLWASSATLTKDNIRKNINKGVDFVDCSGHGTWASWATHPPNDDSIWLPPQTFYSPYTGFLYIDVESFFNSKKLPVVVLNACSTSKFSESPNCLSWKIVSKANGGGIASFGSSGIGYGIPGSGETDALWGWMEVHLFEELVTTKTLGKVWANVINEYLDTFFMLEDADFKTIVEMTMFGDPTTVIEDGLNPQSYSWTPMNHLFFQPGGLRMVLLTLLSMLKQIKEQYT